MEKIKPNYSISFFDRMNNSFSSSPQNYYRAWRKEKGLEKAFLGPWDYLGRKAKSKLKSYNFGDNRTHALSEE